jgi:hypothetical protein
MVPHATDLVQNWLKEVAAISVDGTGASPDVCLIEVCLRAVIFPALIALKIISYFGVIS